MRQFCIFADISFIGMWFFFMLRLLFHMLNLAMRFYFFWRLDMGNRFLLWFYILFSWSLLLMLLLLWSFLLMLLLLWSFLLMLLLLWILFGCRGLVFHWRLFFFWHAFGFVLFEYISPSDNTNFFILLVM